MKYLLKLTDQEKSFTGLNGKKLEFKMPYNITHI